MSVGTTERVTSLTERLRAAQHVLATAEAAAGVRTAGFPVGWTGRRPGSGFSSGGVPGPEVPGVWSAGVPGPEVPGVWSGVDAAAPAPTLSDRFLPVPDALVPLVPFGGLRRGSAVQVEGSTSLLLMLVAAACREGAWCAVVGMPDVGLAAAAEIGLPLDRTALVPAPGADSPEVLGTAIDGFDVVVLGDVPHLVGRDRRRLASRLRHREAVLVTSVPWPGVELVLSATSRWSGLGQGSGSLRGWEMVVRVGGRGGAGVGARQARLRSLDGIHVVPADADDGLVTARAG